MYAEHEMDSEGNSDVEIHEPIPTHVTPNMFTHYQEMPIDIEIVASPVDLQRNPSKCTWKFQPHLSKEFKQNLAVSNRSRAGADDLVGNLERMLPLGFDVQMHGNGFPYAMGIDIPGMMRRNLHRSGMCVHRVPAFTAVQAFDKPIFDAESKVSEHMYRNYRLCTMEDLNEDIEFKPAKGQNEAYASVAVGSLAHETLVDNLRKGHWSEENLSRQQIQSIFHPGDNYTVQVTEKMGKDVKELLRPEVEQVASSFINANNFAVTIYRADGVEGFATPKQIAGAISTAAGGKETATKINMDALNRNAVFYVKGVLKFLLF